MSKIYQSPTPAYKIMDNLILEMEILARIRRGDKLSTIDGVFAIDPVNSIFGSISRKYFGDDRTKTMTAITKSIYSMLEFIGLQTESRFLSPYNQFDEPKEIVNEFLKIQNTRLEIVGRCIYWVWEARAGIENLIETYSGDFNVTSTIKKMSADIKSYIEVICGKLYQDFGNFTLIEKNNSPIKIYVFMENFKN